MFYRNVRFWYEKVLEISNGNSVCDFAKICILKSIYEILNEDKMLKLKNSNVNKLGEITHEFKEEEANLFDDRFNSQIVQFEKYFSK